jgi:hypothetical protein
MAKEEIVAAIRRAAEELGRAPSRGELKRLTGVSHYRVLAEFRTLREAIRAAGLEPNPKGERISTGDLIKDWKRVRKKLGRRPSRAEYVREGKYSAGALTARFGSWGKIGEKPFTTQDTKGHKGGEAKKAKAPGRLNHKGHEGTQRTALRLQGAGDKAIAMRWATQPAQVPRPVAGMRRVTEAVAQLVANTLLGGSWPNLQAKQNGGSGENGLTKSVQLRKDRAVMGEPFDGSPMTNAPINELGVVLLFGMVAARLGFQVESVQGRFPDCEAKREVCPGKWQRSRIEFEYESKNFLLHGHDPKACDVIVCWRHNWRECPAEIEVIELCRIFGQR